MEQVKAVAVKQVTIELREQMMNWEYKVAGLVIELG